MNVLFTVEAGSTAFGLDTPTSDIDIRGVKYRTSIDVMNLAPDRLEQQVKGTVLWDVTRFLQALEKQDINAWVALMSNRTLSGGPAQIALRSIAVRHLLDSDAMIAKMFKAAKAQYLEGTEALDGKLVVNGLRNLLFAFNMARIIPNPACDLRNEREALLTLKGQAGTSFDRVLAYELYETIVNRGYSPGMHLPGTYQHDRALDFLEFHQKYLT